MRQGKESKLEKEPSDFQVNSMYTILTVFDALLIPIRGIQKISYRIIGKEYHNCGESLLLRKGKQENCTKCNFDYQHEKYF